MEGSSIDYDAETEDIEIPPLRVTPLEASVSQVTSGRNEEQSMMSGLLTKEEWKDRQQKDEDLKNIRNWLEKGEKPTYREREILSPRGRKVCRHWEKLTISDGILYRKSWDNHEDRMSWQIVLPQDSEEDICATLHKMGGHFQGIKLESLARRYFYTPQMSEQLSHISKTCRECNVHKGKEQRVPCLKICSNEPFELLTVDFLKIIESESGYTHAMVCVDHFSKYAIVVPTRDQTAYTTARLLWTQVFRIYGCPRRLLSGPNFESRMIQELCQSHGIRKIHTTPYHPQGNGLCERFNRTLLELLRTLGDEKSLNWPDHVQDVVWVYNHLVHRSTGYSPFFLMYGRHGRLPLDLLLQDPEETEQRDSDQWVLEHRRRLLKAQEMVERKIPRIEEVSKSECLPLKIGARVLVRNKAGQRTGKLTARWETEPYVIIGQPYPNIPVYDVCKENGGRHERRLHRNLLRPCGFSEVSTQKDEIEMNDKEVDKGTDKMNEIEWWIAQPQLSPIPREVTDGTESRGLTIVDQGSPRYPSRDNRGHLPTRFKEFEM